MAHYAITPSSVDHAAQRAGRGMSAPAGTSEFCMIQESDSERTTVFRPPPRPAEPVVHALLLRQDGAPPRRIPLGDKPLRIGRGPANELVLQSQEVSRQHCWIGLAGGMAVLTDLN